MDTAAGFVAPKQSSAVVQTLTACADFLGRHLDLANSHPVDFIVKDLWHRILPEEIQEELQALSEDQLKHVPSSRLEHDNKTSQSENDCGDADVLCSNVEKLKVFSNERGLAVKEDLYDCDFSVCANKDCACANNIFPRKSYSPSATWQHSSPLQDFLASVQKHCLENLPHVAMDVASLNSWLHEGGDSEIVGQHAENVFVHAFMKEKKMHEVEIMANVCRKLFDKAAADVVRHSLCKYNQCFVILK
jgi:hypothetical protein